MSATEATNFYFFYEWSHKFICCCPMPYTTSWDSVSVWSSWISRRVGAKNMHVRSREHLVGRFLYMPYRTISHYHVNVRSTYYYCTQSMHFPILIKLWLWSDLPAHPFPNFSSISYFRQHVRGLLRMSRKLYVKLKRLASSIMSNFFKKKKRWIRQASLAISCAEFSVIAWKCLV